ncbi:MAG: hypothetical protein JWO57_2195 [Pseudonocardiales bacterium]|nr:hypothetical protein [Pseudonocardiales bacterium]
MRVALLTYSTRPRGGVVHTLALAEALAALGHHVDVWSLARGGDQAFFRPVDGAVGIRLVPFPDIEDEDVGMRIVRSIKVLSAAFDRHDYDVVHAQDCISANAVPQCIRTVHHLDLFTTPELLECHERAIVRPYAHVCVSAAVSREVEDGWGIRPTVIPNGVEAERFAAAAEDSNDARRARRRWADQLGSYVLAVGGIEPRKGTVELIEAMAVVQKQRPELGLVIAGGETLFDYRDYRATVFDRATELGVHPVLLGTVGHELLPPLMAAAQVFAFPSVKEGFGLAALEAMAARVPVVMRELPVLREVFGDTAVFAATPDELAEQLLNVAGAPDHHRVTAGAALAAEYSWDRAARSHVEFYEQHAIPAR